ncbi:MAG: response regulator [SAR324 cluster bacterium]|nr:response regulator [SAR324 cluster bacterium]
MRQPIILCVDDESMILSELHTQMKRQFDHIAEFEFAESGEEGLRIVNDLMEDGENLTMIISDQIMPGITGDQFLAEVHQKYPKIIKVLLTGQAALESAVNAINHANLFRYIIKPWREEDLMLTVHKGMEQYDLTCTLDAQLNIFRKFVPKQFLQRIARDGIININLGKAESETLAVLFADIRAFTHLAEGLTPQELLNFLNEYFEQINEPIHAHQGFIDKFIGDALMALFDVPEGSNTNSALNAVRSAMEMHLMLHEFNKHRRTSTNTPIQIGVGIHYGPVVIGTVGCKDRMDSTVVGDTVNIAARLEGLCKMYQAPIVVSAEVVKQLSEQDDFVFRQLDWVRVKGKYAPTSVYELINLDPVELRKQKKASEPWIQEGLNLQKQRRWKDAVQSFEKILKIIPNDPVALLHLRRCQQFQNTALPEDWDGSFELEKM